MAGREPTPFRIEISSLEGWVKAGVLFLALIFLYLAVIASSNRYGYQQDREAWERERQDLKQDVADLEESIDKERAAREKDKALFCDELKTWRSRTDYDVDRLFRYLEKSGAEIPASDVPIGVSSPPFC